MDDYIENIAALKERSEELQKSLKKLGLDFTLVDVLSSAGAKDFISFEHSMAVVNTTAGKSGAQFDKLKSQIKGIAEIVPLTREQIASGLYETISAGVPENNWIQFLQDSAKAAIGGQAEVGTIIGTTSALIKDYGKQWDEALSIQDKFQRTVKLGQIPSLQELAAVLPNVTDVASKLNISENELLSTFATTSKYMGGSAEVASRLQTSLNAMLKPSAEATETAKKLGVAFNAESVTKAGGLQNYINELMPKIAAFSQKTGVSQEELTRKLFGSQKAAEMVIGLGGQLSESWSQNTSSISGATGDVENAFQNMAKTSQLQIQLAKNSFNNAMDEVFISARPTLLMLLNIARSVFNLAGKFMRANPMLTKFATIGTMVATALGIGIVMFNYTSVQLQLLRLNYKKLILSMKKSVIWTKAMTVANRILSFVLKNIPIVRIISIILALVGVFALAYNKIGWFRGAIKATWTAIKGFGIAIKNLVVNRIKEMISGITGIGKTLMLFFKGEWREAWETGKEAIGNLTGMGGDSSKKFVEEMKGVGKDSAEAYHKGVAEVEAKNKKKKTSDSGLSVTDITSDATPEIDHLNLTNFTGNGTVDSDSLGSGNNNNLTGVGHGAGKSITMNLDIKNYFTVGGNWRDEVNKIADAVTGKINDKMRDAALSI